MKTPKILLICLLGSVFLGHADAAPEQETRYLAFQIFTQFSSDAQDAHALSSGMREPLVPGTAALRNYVEDIKQRIGTVGDRQTRLAVMLGPLCFDQSDAEITRFVEQAFTLALETDVAVGFHIDDSMFWMSRKDLWSDPQNVEAMDWDGTPCTGRYLNWSKDAKTPTSLAPQMCFNSKAIQREVQQRGTLVGKAIQAGVKRLQQLKRPELFAGVIVGWETMIGQDFETGKPLGYRALLNRGFSREHLPQDMDREREQVVQEFIERWTTGLAEAGVSPQHIYSHTAFLSHRAFGDNQETTYSQRNHFAPPSVAFGKHHRPGFSTYPEEGRFDDIYEELAKHQQVGWASSEGTNLQLGTGPGQSGMGMETYLAKMFNHGGTLVNLYSWGIGGEAMKNMNYRVVTEGAEALQAYRKFLKGKPLIEAKATESLGERLPPKIHKIQQELPAWIAKTGNKEAAPLMQKLTEQVKAKNWEAVEKLADSVLKLMGGSSEPAVSPSHVNAQSPADPGEAMHQRIIAKVEKVKEGVHTWAASGHDPSPMVKTLQGTIKPLLDAGKVFEAEAELDRLLVQLKSNAPSPAGDEPVPRQSGVRAGTKIYRDINYAGTADTNQTLDIFVPPGASVTNRKAAIVYIHGGGWGWDRAADKVGVQSTWPNWQDYILVSINYRLAPEQRWPAQIIDCKSAIRFLRAHAAQYGLDPNEIGVWGGSAGGHLAAMLGTAGAQTRWDEGRHLDQSSRIQAVCARYPPSDFVAWHNQPGGFAGAPPMINVQPLMDAWLPAGLSHDAATLRDASPVTYAAADTPPFLVFHGTADMVVPCTQSRLLVDALNAVHVHGKLLTLQNLNHGGAGWNDAATAPEESAFFNTYLRKAAPSLCRQVRTDPADHFSVWISKLDGSERKLVLSDPKRQMTHTRVSPDLKWIVFTTYNTPGADGFAKEGGNTYANTELCLFKLGGTEIKTIAGPVPGEVNANATFSSDGKRLIFVSTRSGTGALLYWYDIETGLTTQVPTPPAMHRCSDPHEVGDRIVFPAHPGEAGGLQGIWMINRDGSRARQITFPKKSLGAPAESVGQGDYDPRLSPDGSRCTILRNVGGAFHVVLADAASGTETDLTEPLFPDRKQTAEGVAAWSSDGKWLIFRHIALPQDGPRGVGLYLMKPDGSGRKKIPIAKGEFPHVQPEFFPEGSGPDTRVIYQTEKNPNFNF
jgi:acetyl esterase/lipase